MDKATRILIDAYREKYPADIDAITIKIFDELIISLREESLFCEGSGELKLNLDMQKLLDRHCSGFRSKIINRIAEKISKTI